MKNSNDVMKDLKMNKKLKVSVCAMVEKLEVLAFSGLGGVLNSSLATERICFGS